MDNIMDRVPSKLEVIGRCGEDEKNKWPHRTHKVKRNLQKKVILFLYKHKEYV